LKWEVDVCWTGGMTIPVSAANKKQAIEKALKELSELTIDLLDVEVEEIRHVKDLEKEIKNLVDDLEFESSNVKEEIISLLSDLNSDVMIEGHYSCYFCPYRDGSVCRPYHPETLCKKHGIVGKEVDYVWYEKEIKRLKKEYEKNKRL